ncbi:hypothetical protein [Streptomyces sp. NPDC002746]
MPSRNRLAGWLTVRIADPSPTYLTKETGPLIPSTAPVHVLRAITDAYIDHIKQGNLHSALGHMTLLADAYGLPAVRDLASELTCNLHARCPARFRNSLGGVNISALAPARTADPSTVLDIAARANQMVGCGQVTASDLSQTEIQMHVAEDVRRVVQAALDTAAHGRESVSARLAVLSTPQQLSAGVALLTNGLIVLP